MLDWHWLVLGMALMLLELVVPSFTIFWFGLGAMVVAGALWIVPNLPLGRQIFIWAVGSIGFTVLWFKVIRPRMEDRTKAGVALEAIRGQTGRVIVAPREGARGMVRFTVPLLGDEEWQFICEDGEVRIGDAVVVQDVSGNTLIVKKLGSGQ